MVNVSDEIVVGVQGTMSASVAGVFALGLFLSIIEMALGSGDMRLGLAGVGLSLSDMGAGTRLIWLFEAPVCIIFGR
jgi:hypothetical protein